MTKHHFKITLRNLLRDKSFSLINILGLAIGISACLLIFLFVHHELTYDRFNTKAERIVRVASTFHTPESTMPFATSPKLLASTLKKQYPEVESTVRLEPFSAFIKTENELFKEPAFYKTEQSIFSIFSFDFIKGSVNSALRDPRSIVLTASTARKYFGNGQALAATINCNGEDLRVTGIIADRPANSDIKIDALLSADYGKTTLWMDEDFSVYTFVLFNKMPDLKKFGQKMDQLSAKYVQPELNEVGAENYRVSFEAEPLTQVHFSQGRLVDTPKGNKRFNYIFSLLAFFILIIALLNYINLSTAKAADRAKEVGIRKVSGALPFQLIRQFLFESFILVSIAWIIAFIMVLVSLPFFSRMLDATLSLTWQGSALYMICIFFVTVLLAGLYPAFSLSRFRPAAILKGNWKHSSKGIFLRKSLTIAQFVITASLITGAIVIYNQMRYIEHKNLGFVKDQVVTIHVPFDSASRAKVSSFIQSLRQQPAIGQISSGSGIQADGISMASTFAESEGSRREMMANYFFIDEQFLSLLNISLKEGRNLSDSLATDKNEAFLVNEAFVEKMAWKSAIGQSLEGFGHKGKVVGVVKNFYYKSLHNLVEPLIMIYNTFPVSAVMIKIPPEKTAGLKALWASYFPALPFEYSFLDEIYAAQYKKDKLTMTLFSYFTILAIFISCLGLYGLVSLVAVQRTKEIGIRKVLGASLGQLVSLLSGDFLKLIFLAALISFPIAWIAMDKWLGSYAYHIDITWWMFALPVFMTAIIALLVIGKQILKAALINPVNSLRME